MALAFALGNFPQLVRDLHPLWQAGDLAALRPSADARPLPATALVDWAARATGPVPKLLAAGVLRVARQFDRARGQLLREMPQDPPGRMAGSMGQAKVDGAGLAPRPGRRAALEASRHQPDSVPVLFNRGMAELFLGRGGRRGRHWNRPHGSCPRTIPGATFLARLYLALAEARG